MVLEHVLSIPNGCHRVQVNNIVDPPRNIVYREQSAGKIECSISRHRGENRSSPNARYAYTTQYILVAGIISLMNQRTSMYPVCEEVNSGALQPIFFYQRKQLSRHFQNSTTEILQHYFLNDQIIIIINIFCFICNVISPPTERYEQ